MFGILLMMKNLFFIWEDKKLIGVKCMYYRKHEKNVSSFDENDKIGYDFSII